MSTPTARLRGPGGDPRTRRCPAAKAANLMARNAGHPPRAGQRVTDIVRLSEGRKKGVLTGTAVGDAIEPSGR